MRQDNMGQNGDGTHISISSSSLITEIFLSLSSPSSLFLLENFLFIRVKRIRDSKFRPKSPSVIEAVNLRHAMSFHAHVKS